LLPDGEILEIELRQSVIHGSFTPSAVGVLTAGVPARGCAA